MAGSVVSNRNGPIMTSDTKKPADWPPRPSVSGPERLSPRGPIAPNKANFPRFWPENQGPAKKQTQSTPIPTPDHPLLRSTRRRRFGYRSASPQHPPAGLPAHRATGRQCLRKSPISRTIPPMWRHREHGSTNSGSRLGDPGGRFLRCDSIRQRQQVLRKRCP